MSIDEILEILSPIDDFVGDKVLVRDYRKISLELDSPIFKGRNNNYHQFLWYDNHRGVSIEFKLYDDTFTCKLTRYENDVFFWSKSIEDLEIILNYFISAISSYYDNLRLMDSYTYGIPPKDFIREFRLSKILD